MTAEESRLLEQEINQQIRRLKFQIGRAARCGDEPLADTLQIRRVELVAWHQLLLTHQQTLRHRRHIEFCERFRQAAQEQLDPSDYQRLLTAASTPVNGGEAGKHSTSFSPEKLNGNAQSG